MRKVIILSACFLYTLRVPAQEISSSGDPVFGSAVVHVKSLKRDIKYSIDRILSVIGPDLKFQIKAAHVKNAQASYRFGKKIIKYNADYFSALLQKSGDDWILIFVLAHEMGHHLKGHTRLKKNNRNYQTELDADEFAAGVLQKLGASMDQAKRSIEIISSPVCSRTHPGTAERVKVVEKAWKQ